MSITIRVYGLIIDQGKILLTDEYRMGMKMSKFPGGGLEEGEGILDCLKREIREELGHEIIAHQHFYTTDFYQQSIFNPDELQVINVYYFVKINKPFSFSVTEKRFDFENLTDGVQTFRWVDLNQLEPHDVDLPIDQFVVGLLKKNELKPINGF